MGGTREGGLKAAQTLKQKDPDYFKKLRARAKNVGGKHAANGFDKDPERARSAGAEGGRKSRRRKTTDDDQKAPEVRDPQSSQDTADNADVRRGAGPTGQSDQPAGRGGKA